MSAIGADAGLPLGGASDLDAVNWYPLRGRKRKARSALERARKKANHQGKAKRAEDRERRRNRIRRNGLQLLVAAAGFHQFGEANVADRNGGFVKGLDRCIPHETQKAESSAATAELSSVSAAARLLMRSFNDRSYALMEKARQKRGSRPGGAHEPGSEDEQVMVSDEDSTHLRGGGFFSGDPSTTDGVPADWTEESETDDDSMSDSDSDSILTLDSELDGEELSRDIDEIVEETVDDLFDGDLTMSDTMRQQTKVQLRERLLEQELGRATERRMRRVGAFGGNAGHQGQPLAASNRAGGPEAMDWYNTSPPGNAIFPANPVPLAGVDGGHGYQGQDPDANLSYPLQWRMFHGLDSNWVVRGRGNVNTDNIAAANNQKQWAFERSIALAKNYTSFDGQGQKGEIEGYPLRASADLVGEGVRPLTLAPRDTELLGAIDPATSVRYAYEHPRISLRAQSQSQRYRRLFKSKPEGYVEQSEVDAQLNCEASTSSGAFTNPNKGPHGHIHSKEKPPFPLTPPLPVDYNPFAHSAPQWEKERGPFPMSPMPSANKLFNGGPTSVWQGGDLFEGIDGAAEPVTLRPMEKNEKHPFPMSPALDGPRLTPSEPVTPSSIFGPPATPEVAATFKTQNESWAHGPIPGIPHQAPNVPGTSSGTPAGGSPGHAHAVQAPIPTSPVVEGAGATPDTTQDAVVTEHDYEHEAARFQATITGEYPATAGPAGHDAPRGSSEAGAPERGNKLPEIDGGGSEDTACPATPESSFPAGVGAGVRVMMPTVPQTRLVADKAIRDARCKPSFTNGGRKPMC